MAAASSGADRITADGGSESWTNNQTYQRNLGDMFLQHIAGTNSALSSKWGTSWENIPEEFTASFELYECFAHWLCRVHLKKDGKHLELGGAVAVWGGVIYQHSTRFKHSTRPETKVCARARCLARAACDSLRSFLRSSCAHARPPCSPPSARLCSGLLRVPHWWARLRGEMVPRREAEHVEADL